MKGSRILKPYNSKHLLTYKPCYSLMMKWIKKVTRKKCLRLEKTWMRTLRQVQSPSPNADKPDSSHVQDTDESTSESSLDLKKFDNILPLTERQLVKYLRKVFRVLFNRLTEAQWVQHKEADVSHADLKAAIKGYYEENINHREQTDKVIEAAMNSHDKNSIARGDLLNALNGVTKELMAFQDFVKENLVLNKKVHKATWAYTKISTHLTELLTLIKNFDFQGLKSLVECLQSTALT
nr:hypothetical protein [Tanacetum cinerariifolium]